MIDFSALHTRLIGQSRSLLPAWFPAGKFRGSEFVVGNLRGDPGDSLSINWTTGQWADFASSDKGGDLISLYAAIHSLSQPDAARQLNDEPAYAPAELQHKKGKRNVVAPVPDGVRECLCLHWKLGKAVHVWNYRDADGRLLGHVARYDLETIGANGKRDKETIPWTYAVDAKGKGKWGMGGFAVPRPLYGLDDLAKRVNEPVMIVEGEKAAEAARAFARQYVVITWPGGCHAVHKVDWLPLKGRTVLLWPDCDNPGIEAMWKLGHMLLKLCPTVKIIIPDGKPEGWDAADALDEWQGDVKEQWGQFKAWAIPRLTELKENGGQDEQTRETGNVPIVNESNDEDGRKSDRAHGIHNEDSRDAGTFNTGAPDGSRRARKPAPVDNRGGSASGGEQGTAVETAGQAKQPDAVPSVQQEEVAPRRSRELNWVAWKLDCDGGGFPRPNLNNAVAVLEYDPAFNHFVWFDEFLQRILTNDGAGGVREWTDADDINLTLDMQRRLGIARMGRETVQQAVVAMAMRSMQHCVRDWLDGLQWDGEPRIDHFFEDNFGAPGTDYVRAVSKNFFLSLVARVFLPGCQVDNMVVLEGKQGAFKSQTLKALGGNWFSKQHESVINPKAFAEILQGAWLVEIDEMKAFTRAEVSGIKAIVSTQWDRYRPAYGRYAKVFHRQCVFVGTTNENDWNKDETGARRFWPIECFGLIDIENVRRYREQFFAEAVHRFKAVPLDADPGVRMAAQADWWETPSAATKQEQSRRFDSDPWFDVIQEWIGIRQEVLINEVLTECLDLKMRDVTSREQRRVAVSLRQLGWKNSGNSRLGHRVVKIWKPDSGV